MFLEFEKPIVGLENRIQDLRKYATEEGVDCGEEIKALEAKLDSLRRGIYSSLNAWQITQLARCPGRPYFLDYVNKLFNDFIEFHGDRVGMDDHALIGGPAFFKGESVMLIGHQKGRETKENLQRNFGMSHPEGYRKAQRLMKLAEKFFMPVITFIDTPGAYPGIAAEEHGQGRVIAENLKLMSELRTPIISIIIGEGGSGGALAIGMGNYIIMLENAIYSVISPEGCASILYKDAHRANDAAAALKLTANDLIELKVIDEVIPEPLGGAHHDADDMAKRLGKVLFKCLSKFKKMSPDKIVQDRYDRFRNMGIFLQSSSGLCLDEKNIHRD